MVSVPLQMARGRTATGVLRGDYRNACYAFGLWRTDGALHRLIRPNRDRGTIPATAQSTLATAESIVATAQKPIVATAQKTRPGGVGRALGVLTHWGLGQ